jgi:hypothetical protein
MAHHSASFADRFAAKVRRAPNGCLEWTGARSVHGYGRINRGGRGAGVELAPRAAWIIANGPIPDGLSVLHRCDNPPCCDVSHLFLGTAEDNCRDMMAKGRGRGQVQGGAHHPSARLTDQQVAEMRAAAPTIRNYAELGRRYGVSKQHARSIVIGLKRSA